MFLSDLKATAKRGHKIVQSFVQNDVLSPILISIWPAKKVKWPHFSYDCRFAQARQNLHSESGILPPSTVPQKHTHMEGRPVGPPANSIIRGKY